MSNLARITISIGFYKNRDYSRRYSSDYLRVRKGRFIFEENSDLDIINQAWEQALEVLQKDKPVEVKLNNSRLIQHKSLKAFNISASGYFYDDDKFLHIKFKDTGRPVDIKIKRVVKS